jgi:hypothetical protein
VLSLERPEPVSTAKIPSRASKVSSSRRNSELNDDIAVVWRPRAAPLVIAIMSNRSSTDAEPGDRLIARAASAVATELG